MAPVLLLVIFFAIQAGLFFYGRAVAQQAAREGVSQLRLAQTTQISDGIRDRVQESVERYAQIVGRETLLEPKATTTYDANAGTVSVSVRGTVITLVPGVTLHVTQQVVGQIERFEEDTTP